VEETKPYKQVTVFINIQCQYSVFRNKECYVRMTKAKFVPYTTNKPSMLN